MFKLSFFINGPFKFSRVKTGVLSGLFDRHTTVASKFSPFSSINLSIRLSRGRGRVGGGGGGGVDGLH